MHDWSLSLMDTWPSCAMVALIELGDVAEASVRGTRNVSIVATAGGAGLRFGSSGRLQCGVGYWKSEDVGLPVGLVHGPNETSQKKRHQAKGK